MLAHVVHPCAARGRVQVHVIPCAACGRMQAHVILITLRGGGKSYARHNIGESWDFTRFLTTAILKTAMVQDAVSNAGFSDCARAAGVLLPLVLDLLSLAGWT